MPIPSVQTGYVPRDYLARLGMAASVDPDSAYNADIYGGEQMTPEQLAAYQQSFWLPQIATGGYIPPEFDNPEAMAALGQTEAYAQRQQYLNAQGQQRIQTLQDRRARSAAGSIAPRAALLLGAGASTAGVLAGGAAAAPAAGGGSSLSPITLPSSVAPIASPVGSSAATLGTTAAAAPAAASFGPGTAAAASTAGGAIARNWPIIAASLISGVTGIAGANAMESGAEAAVAESRRQFDTAREDALPYIGAGHDALSRLRALSGLDGSPPDYSGFENAPGRQFAIQQGERSINRSLAARGKAISGEGVREGIRYATGMADQGFNNYWNQLAGVAGLGQTTGAQNAVVGANSATTIGNAQQNQGVARASGYAAANNAAVGGLSNYLLMQQLAKRP